MKPGLKSTYTSPQPPLSSRKHFAKFGVLATISFCCDRYRAGPRDDLRFMAPPIPEKRGGLTLEKLASYDDVITDALVDKAGSLRKARLQMVVALRKNRLSNCVLD